MAARESGGQGAVRRGWDREALRTHGLGGVYSTCGGWGGAWRVRDRTRTSVCRDSSGCLAESNWHRASVDAGVL